MFDDSVISCVKCTCVPDVTVRLQHVFSLHTAVNQSYQSLTCGGDRTNEWQFTVLKRQSVIEIKRLFCTRCLCRMITSSVVSALSSNISALKAQTEGKKTLREAKCWHFTAESRSYCFLLFLFAALQSRLSDGDGLMKKLQTESSGDWTCTKPVSCWTFPEWCHMLPEDQLLFPVSVFSSVCSAFLHGVQTGRRTQQHCR